MDKLKRLVKLTKGIIILQEALKKYKNEYLKNNDISVEKLNEIIKLLLMEEKKIS